MPSKPRWPYAPPVRFTSSTVWAPEAAKVRDQATTTDVRDACSGKDNLLERFVAAAHADCTLGEIADVLRERFGKYKEPRIL